MLRTAVIRHRNALVTRATATTARVCCCTQQNRSLHTGIGFKQEDICGADMEFGMEKSNSDLKNETESVPVMPILAVTAVAALPLVGRKLVRNIHDMFYGKDILVWE